MASGSLALVTARAPCVSIRDQFIFVCHCAANGRSKVISTLKFCLLLVYSSLSGLGIKDHASMHGSGNTTPPQ